MDAGKDIIKSKAKLIKTPILYSHGDIDPINDYKGTLQAYGLTPSTDKEMKTWPGLFHECKLIKKETTETFFLFLLTLF